MRQAFGTGGPPRSASRSPWLGAAALRSGLWLLLGGQVGAWALFAVVVAPTAFRVLPGAETAGRLIGPVLGALQIYGAIAGVCLAILALALRRGPLLLVLPLLMSVLCLVSQFGVTPAIAEVRDQAFGPGGSEEAAARFAALHRASVFLYGTVGLLALALLGLHAVADARELAAARRVGPSDHQGAAKTS